MNAKELLKAGKLTEAVRALTAEVRDNPADVQRRTFLFELLCFAGEYDRAEKHLGVLAPSGDQTQAGAMFYTGILQAERNRQEMFRKKEYPAAMGTANLPGTLNGRPFQSLCDADPRIGGQLEVFAAGSYLWLPLEHLESIEMPPPRRLRDLIWAPAVIRTGTAFQGPELSEVLLPALSPLSFTHGDEEVRLGHITVWEEQEDGSEIPFGQKMLLADGEEVPLLELRSLQVEQAAATP